MDFNRTKSMPTFRTIRGLVEYRFDKRGRSCVLLFNGGHTNPGMRDSEHYFIDRDYSVISVRYCRTRGAGRRRGSTRLGRHRNLIGGSLLPNSLLAGYIADRSDTQGGWLRTQRRKQGAVSVAYRFAR